jgi:hypothetical protein
MINTKALGRRQKALIEWLKKGYFISLYHNMSLGEKEISLNYEDDEIQKVDHAMVVSLCKRHIIIGKQVGSTTMPDTESWRFVINPEYKI